MVRITLTTLGRRSGMPREVQLYAFQVGKEHVIVGSKGGAPVDPAWVANLRAEPLATLRLGKRKAFAVHAREVSDPSARERLWPLACEGFPLYEKYQTRTTRLFPLFALVEVAEADGPMNEESI